MNIINLVNDMKITNFFAFFLFFASSFALASDTQVARQEVTNAAKDFVLDNIPLDIQGEFEISVNPIDQRLEIPVCEEPLSLSSKDDVLEQTTISVRVECLSSDWYLYVIVKTQQMQEVVVVNGVLSPGTILSQDNLRVEKIEKQRLRRSTFANINEVLGARMKRRVRDGQPISPNQLCYICKGDSIVITADVEGLFIKTSGIAQQDGNIGDTILVRNSQSRKIIDAVVKSASSVSVNI